MLLLLILTAIIRLSLFFLMHFSSPYINPCNQCDSFLHFFSDVILADERIEILAIERRFLK